MALRDEQPSIKEVKIDRLAQALIDTDGFVAKASKLCEISRDTAHRMIKRSGRLKILLSELRRARRRGEIEEINEDEYMD